MISFERVYESSQTKSSQVKCPSRFNFQTTIRLNHSNIKMFPNFNRSDPDRLFHASFYSFLAKAKMNLKICHLTQNRLSSALQLFLPISNNLKKKKSNLNYQYFYRAIMRISFFL